jgi:uncharacterized Zn finger protein
VNKTWWGEEFLEALKSFTEEGRLSRGSAYRTPRRLSEYKQKQNVVSATMMGNMNPYFGVYKTPYYKTKIAFTKISNPESIVNNIENDPLLLAKLITRELPSSISFILPQSKKDIETSCSCPDWENPCKHVAGLYLKIAEMIDHNPLLLFDLRGISETLISDKIKKHINVMHEKTDNTIMPITPIKDTETEEVNIKSFWGNPNKKLKTSLSVKIPSVLVRKAGVNPPFWYKRKSFLDCMNNIYKNVNRSWSRMLK